MLAFASAWIVGLINLLASDKPLPPGFQSAAAFALPVFGGAAIISLISFFPRLRPSKVARDPDAPKNLLFFGDIADVELDEYRRDSRKAHRTPAGSTSDGYVEDLETQAWINSRIARRKYRFFSLAALFAVAAIVILIIPAVLLAYHTLIRVICAA